MRWRIVVAFLIGLVLGAVSLFLYLQASGKLQIQRRVAARAAPVASARNLALPAQPAGVPVPSDDAVRVERMEQAAGTAHPKPLAFPQSEAGAILAPGAVAVPVVGVEKRQLRDQFNERRGTRRHEALDIMAPRATPVVAALDGRIRRLFMSDAGGNTIYLVDPEEKFIYYYAHLDRYAEDLFEGKPVRRGEVIGYVGTSGNAAEDAPHLHFGIARLPPTKEWWKGEAINPYPVLMQHGVTYQVQEP